MKKLARFALIGTLSAAFLTSVAFTSPEGRTLAAPASAPTTLPNASWEGWLYGAAGYTRAVEMQKELNVPLVVYFYTDWCPYCRTLDSMYLPSAPAQDYLRGVVKVRINAEQGFAERALAKRFGVTGYPSFFVMRHSATRPVNVSPFRRVGNLSPTQFANACRTIAPVSRKAAAVQGRGKSGKFSERRESLVTTKRTTGGGAQIVTVTPTAKKVGGRKQ